MEVTPVDSDDDDAQVSASGSYSSALAENDAGAVDAARQQQLPGRQQRGGVPISRR
jgi:hypothetical protein